MYRGSGLKERYSMGNQCSNRHRGKREQRKRQIDRKGDGGRERESNVGEWVRGMLCGCKRAGAQDSEKKVREWKRERERGSKRCRCFLNSLRGTPNPLSSTNQLTDCHLPRTGGGARLITLSTDTFAMQRRDRALPMLALENSILSKHRPPGGQGEDEGDWN